MSRRLLSLLAVMALAIALLAPTGVGASEPQTEPLLGDVEKLDVEESEFGSYVVVMKADPLVVTEGREALETTQARSERRRLRESHDRALRDVGASAADKVNDYTNALNGFSALISHDQAIKLAAKSDVALVVADELRQKMTDSSPEFLGLSQRGGAWDRGIRGDGVVVGVIDTGIWPEHPSFADDGTYPPAPVSPSLPCQFGNTAHNPADVPFTCNNKLVGARQSMPTYRAVIGADPDEFNSARDDDGHGSHTAGTAAGNAGVTATLMGRDRGEISGIAPRAHVIAYKGLGRLGGFTSDLAGAIDQAVLDGVDVINYSVGGGANLIGADSIAFLFAADAGVWTATSAGNSGPGPATIGSPANAPWVTSVGANTQRRFFAGNVVLGDGRIYTGASVTDGIADTPLVDAATGGDDSCLAGTLDPSLVAGKIVLCRGQSVRWTRSKEVLRAGGVGMILYTDGDDFNLASDNHWVPSVHIDHSHGLEIKAYIASSANPTARIRATNATTKWESAPSMTVFSSRGPNPVAADIIKPDITAPGIQILAAHSPLPDPDYVPGQMFQAIMGTSMSGPHVAGAYALLRQARPDWSQAAAKSALMTSADRSVRDNDRVSQAGPFAMGAGHLDLGSPTHDNTAFNPGLVYDAGLFDYYAFLCDAAPQIFVDPTGTCALLEALGYSTDASDLNLASIGVASLAGSQTVTRTVTNVDHRRSTYRVSVDEPAGYDVTVSPSSFVIEPGESVTYEVTITNDGSATAGIWSTGSLNWKSSRFDVPSPIAVNASMFDAPASVDGSGASGSVTFNVDFGYTGPYTAGAHGLVAATVTSDNVVQDPDQVFNPNDGYSNLHTIAVNNAALLRIAIPPDATEAGADLDVYVYNPSGQFVASSTLPNTDELINIPNPVNGNWFVFVHGWFTPGGDSDYDMYSWAVPTAPGGGTLAITSAPPSATIGVSAPVTASWTGAGGTWNLGAVSHTGPDGLMGLTLVNVDNRP